MEGHQDQDLALGDPAPGFRLHSGDGREITLAEYRGKANVVLFFVRAFE